MKILKSKIAIIDAVNRVGIGLFGFAFGAIVLSAIPIISPVLPGANPAIYVEVLRPLYWFLALGIVLIISILMMALELKKPKAEA